MKILITGAGGQLGREWVDFLSDTDHDLLALSSSDLDITKSDVIHTLFSEENPDLLINCAAYTQVDDAEDNPEDAYSVNEIGVQNLAHACKRHHVYLVHFSTDYVFAGNKADQKKLPNGYDEEFPPSPQNVYGKSKRGGEQAIEKFADQWMIIRVSWLCGKHGHNFIKTILRLSKEKSELRVVDDQTGAPTFCFDVVEKTMKLIEMDQTGYFHISSDGATTWYGVAEELIRLTGSETKLKAVSSSEYEMKAERPAYSLLNTHKIEELGLKPLDWKKGMETMLSELNELTT